MKLTKYLYFSLLLGTLSGCSDMFDEKTSNEWDTDMVWSNSDFARGVLDKAYVSIPNRPDNYDGNFLDAATDNALTNKYGSSIYKLGSGNYSSVSYPINNWGLCYQMFQYINTFLENGLTENTDYNPVDEEQDAKMKSRLKGEAYFLRAFWGFELLKMYGGKTESGEALGYPISLHFITEEEAERPQDFKRNTYQECADQIMADCDVAIELLPIQYTGDDPISGKKDAGRATKLAALALKSKVSLYAASPAYQSDDCVSLDGMGMFTIKNSDEYEAHWMKAIEIADQILKMSQFKDGYTKLENKYLADCTDAVTPPEFLFRFFHSSKELETRHFPPFYFGDAANVPTQNLVDAYPSKSGYPITDKRSLYSEDTPYEGRDDRFYRTIYFHGQKFGKNGKPIDVAEGGRDSYTFNRNASRTGYYLAKFLSTNDNILSPTTGTNVQHYYPLLRKAEIFLNFAEASNEVFGPRIKGTYHDAEGNTVTCKYSAYDIIKMIRKNSAGITDVTYLDEVADQGKDAFRKLIQNERRLELVFENHRFYDIRRWLLPFDNEIKGVSVTKNEDGKYDYNMGTIIEKRKFDDIRSYYMPIPYGECVKNPNLVNNVGW